MACASAVVQPYGIYVRQLCQRALESLQTVPPEQRRPHLTGYLRKWSGGKEKINFHQFRGALQSMSLPLHAAGEVFAMFGSMSNGAVDIHDLASVLLTDDKGLAKANGDRGATPSAAYPRPPRVPGTPAAIGAGPGGGSVMRSAGNSLVGGGAGSLGTPKQTPSRGNTPQSVMSQSSQRRDQSRGASASRPQPRQIAAAAREGSAADVDLAGGVVAAFRAAVLRRGVSSIHAIARIFRIMDNDGNRKLSAEELQFGLRDLGMKMSLKDAELLLAAIDRDNFGSVSFNSFLIALRGQINPHRRALIDMAFDILDKTGDGVVRVDDIQASFSTQYHPEVAAGRLPEAEALEHFLSQFDGPNRDGCVTREEFVDYYQNISASIDDDSYFELMMRNAWHISGGTGAAANTANARILVTFDDGSQRVVEIKDDLGLDLNDPVAVRARLDEQGLVDAVGYELSA